MNDTKNFFDNHYHIFFLIVLTISLISVGYAEAAEFNPYGTDAELLSLGEYYTNHGAPNVSLETNCPDEGDCRTTVQNNNGETLKKFGTDSSIESVSGARYWSQAYLLVRKSYKCDDDTCERTILFDDSGNEIKISPGWNQGKVLDIFITFKGKIAILEEDGLQFWTSNGNKVHTVTASESLTRGRIQANLDGKLAIIGVSADDNVWLGDAQSLSQTDMELAKRGDRRGILAAYPIPDNGTASVVYDYENPYRKGLYLVRTHGEAIPVFLSSERNVGWDPQLLITGDTYYISATDSTHDRRVQISMPQSTLKGNNQPEPDLEKFPSGGNVISMFAGGGVMSRYWRAESEVENSGNEFTKVDYNFDQSLLREARFQGRVGSTRYVLSYLEQVAQDEVEEKAGLTASEGVEYLTGMVEFEDFFSPSSGFRIKYRRSETNGLASITHSSKPDTSLSFDVQFQEFGFFTIGERGRYYGLQYTDYQLPSAVGFSDQNQNIVYSDFDSGFEFLTLALVGGYDPPSYAKRYETNYSDWFGSWEGGAGLGWAELSDNIKKQAKSATGKDEISLPIFLSIDASLESGYLWQLRSRQLGGLGVQSMIGYRADGSYKFAGRDEDSDNDKLMLEFERHDIWHGPFFEFNIIF